MMKIMKNRASKFGRFKYKKYQKPNPGRGKYNNTENRGFQSYLKKKNSFIFKVFQGFLKNN